MNIRPSSALRNEYPQIAELAWTTGEPVFITNKEESDGVSMSLGAFEKREKMYQHRASRLLPLFSLAFQGQNPVFSAL